MPFLSGRGNSPAIYGAAAAPFSPDDIAGIQLWLDASDSATITIATGVSQWDDKSGNSRHASQATGSKQPTVNTAAQNGLDTIRFTSANSQEMALAGTDISVDSAYTIAFVGQRAGPSGTNEIALLGAAGSRGLWWNSGTDLTVYNSTNYAQAAIASTVYNSIICTLTGSTGAIYLNGTLQTTNIGAFSLAAVWDTLGHIAQNGIYTNADIAEVIVYDTVLSSGDRTSVQDYLKAKWGTP